MHDEKRYPYCDLSELRSSLHVVLMKSFLGESPLGAAADCARQYLNLALPYYFSDLARKREDNLRRGDHVRIRWKEEIIGSNTVMRAVGDWLFGKKRVYRLSEVRR